MTVQISERQLARIESGRDQVARVRVGRKDYVLLSRSFYEQVRPLLDYMTRQPAKASDARATAEWTEEKNARRVALVNKKYDQGLTAAERKELKQLQAEVDRFGDRAVPARNEVLELLLLGAEIDESILTGADRRGREPDACAAPRIFGTPWRRAPCRLPWNSNEPERSRHPYTRDPA